MTSKVSGTPQPAAADPDSPKRERHAARVVRRELIILGITLACGLFLMPFLIWMVGNRILGPYTHGQDATAGTGPLRLLADYFTGLAHGSIIFWCVAIGPTVLLTLIRLLFWYLLSKPPADSAPRDASTSLNRGRIEPHL
jgi:hypothetical protein